MTKYFFNRPPIYRPHRRRHSDGAGNRRRREISLCAAEILRTLVQFGSTHWLRTVTNHLAQLGAMMNARQIGVVANDAADPSGVSPLVWNADAAAPHLIPDFGNEIPAVRRDHAPSLAHPNPALQQFLQRIEHTGVISNVLHLTDGEHHVWLWVTLPPPRRLRNAEVWLLWILADAVLVARMKAQASALLQHNEARYQLLTTHSTDLISVHTHEGIVQYCSPASIAMLGYQPEELIGRTPADFIHPDDQLAALQRGMLQSSGAVTTMFRLRHQAGYYVWVESAVRLVCDPTDGAVREIIAISRDIETRRNFEAQIEHLSSYDSLTKLVNRRRFQEIVERSLAEASQAGSQLAIFYLDLDQFKKVNDSLGHGAGDELLVQVSERVRGSIGEQDQLARLGGDEFALMLPYQSGQRAIEPIAERLIEQMRQPFIIRKQQIYLGASIGIAYAPYHGTNFEVLLQHADIAMSHAKVEGNRYQVFDPRLSTEIQQRLRIESDLRSALGDAQLRLYYQPIYSLITERIVAVEALVRWQHPTLGLLPPNRFVPVAETSDLIRDLDRAVIRMAAVQLGQWLNQGHDVVVTVNLSVRTLHDPHLPEYIREHLMENHVRPEYLTIEVTESTAMSEVQLTINVLNELRASGMRVAIDDFGSGHSSLNYLRTLPIDYVKIDRDFITNINHTSYDAAVVRAVVALGAGLNVPVVAEGVEYPEQIELLRSIGCTMVQGYAIGRPMPPEMLQLPPSRRHAAD